MAHFFSVHVVGIYLIWSIYILSSYKLIWYHFRMLEIYVSYMGYVFVAYLDVMQVKRWWYNVEFDMSQKRWNKSLIFMICQCILENRVIFKDGLRNSKSQTFIKFHFKIASWTFSHNFSRHICTKTLIWAHNLCVLCFPFSKHSYSFHPWPSGTFECVFIAITHLILTNRSS